jgi:hypothetical protein
VGKKGRGKVAGCGGNRGGGGPARQRRRRREEGGGERLTGGAQLSSKGKEKKKKGGGVGWRGEGMVCRWAAGPERRGGKFSSFFPFSFQTLFK